MNFLFSGPHTVTCFNFLQPPADIINRKRPASVCFPYNAIQYLWCRIDELIRSGHMVDACEKLRNLLHGALLNHLKLVCYIRSALLAMYNHMPNIYIYIYLFSLKSRQMMSYLLSLKIFWTTSSSFYDARQRNRSALITERS